MNACIRALLLTSLSLGMITGALWTAVSERDGLGDDLPPDFAPAVFSSSSVCPGLPSIFPPFLRNSSMITAFRCPSPFELLSRCNAGSSDEVCGRSTCRDEIGFERPPHPFRVTPVSPASAPPLRRSCRIEILLFAPEDRAE